MRQLYVLIDCIYSHLYIYSHTVYALNVDHDYKRVDVCDTTRLFRFSCPQFGTGIKGEVMLIANGCRSLNLKSARKGLALVTPLKIDI